MAEQPVQMTEEQRKALEEKLKNMSPDELRELQKKQCIFCQICAGKIPAKKVFEDDKVLVILDINPAAKGHLLLMVKEHYAIMPQIPDPMMAHATIIAKKMSQLLLQAFKSSGTTIFIANGAAAGQRSQHFMLHIIPRKEGDNLLPMDEKLLDKELHGKIKQAVESKLLPLLGVTQEKQKVLSEDYPKEEKDEELEEEIAELKSSMAPEAPVEESKATSEQKTKAKPAPKPRKTKGGPKTEEPETEEPKKEEGGASLDDIADLFK